jgi:hypothetical protein
MRYCKRGHERTPENVTKSRACKICSTINARERYGKNPETIRKAKIWKKNNPEKVRLTKEKYLEKNQGKAKREWSKNNPEKLKQYNKKYYSENTEERKKNAVEWKTNNRDKVNARQNRAAAEIHDSYAAKRLGLKITDVHPDVLDLQRLHIKLKREIKNASNQNSK